MLVGCTGHLSAAEHKSLRSLVRKPVARLRPKNHFATLPTKFAVDSLPSFRLSNARKGSLSKGTLSKPEYWRGA